ncbi:MAG TPA: secretin N-terminal domain-containing protein [Candidatus Methylomirabilis sp.]|nr:secretin N-terminal domain-containing protein [Candidatus Methylomirabilis sp.]
MAAGRWEEAVSFYLDVVRQDPRNIEARIFLARSLNEASNSTLKQGQELEAAGRLEEATAAYRLALRYNGENRGAQEGLDRLGRAAEVQARLTRARELMQKADLPGAQAEVAAALLLNPASAEAKALQREVTLRLQAEKPPPKAEKEQVAELFSLKPVTLRFRDTDIKEVLEVLARTAGVNIFTDETLPAKRVTIFLKDLPLREAFNMILVSNRLFAKLVAENTVIVIPDNPGKRQQYDDLMVQTFYLSDADAKVTVNLLRTILNTRQIFVNEKLNALVVRETPEKIELARKLLEANDRGGAEVEIDVEVLEVDRTALENLGIDIQPRTYQVSLIPPAALPFWGPQLFKQFLSQSQINTSGLTPALILNLVKNDSNTKILANPTVRILDRQKARLLIGQRRPFQISSLTSVPAVAGTTGTGTTPGSLPTGAVTTTQTNVEYRDIGLKLTLTPTIGLTGDVTIELSFEISAVGASIVSATTGGELIPPVNTRNIDTFVKVRNGETRLLGGLLQQTTSETNSKLPFLSEIPLLGRLFTNPTYNLDRVDVLISLTPRLVKTLERPAADIERFSSGTAESFGPAGGAIAPPVFTPQPAPVPVPAPPAGVPTPPAGAPPAGAAPIPPGGAPAGPRP